MRQRDNFPMRVKNVLSERAAYFCSNPQCRKLTAGPHSEFDRSLVTGHAAHIHAASPGGPRYDANQTQEERSSIENGLWLCRECGVIVDNDQSGHSAATLRQWKSDHEALIHEVRSEGYARSLKMLQAGAEAPEAAERLLGLFDDHRALWNPFDAEFPSRVLTSLVRLRDNLVAERRKLALGSPLNALILALNNTVLAFFNQVEKIDLNRLRCDSRDPEWIRFRDALAALRKSVRIQVEAIASAYGLKVGGELGR